MDFLLRLPPRWPSPVSARLAAADHAVCMKTQIERSLLNTAWCTHIFSLSCSGFVCVTSSAVFVPPAASSTQGIFGHGKGFFCFFLNLQRHYRFLKSSLIADGSCSITVSGNQSPGLCFSRLRLQVTPHWTEILSMSLLCHHYIWLTDLEIVVVWALLRGNTSPRRSDTAASVISGGNVLITANEYSWRSTTINRREC